MMELGKVIINNFRKLNTNVTVEFDDEVLIVGKNNTAKTSIFEIFLKFLDNGKVFKFEDFNYKSITKDVINGIYTDYRTALEAENRTKLEQLEIARIKRLPSIKLDIEILISKEDNLADIRNLLFEFDNNKQIILSCNYEIKDLNKMISRYELYNSFIRKRNESVGNGAIKVLDFYEYFKRFHSEHYIQRFYTYKDNVEYIHPVAADDVRRLFNIGIITAQREVDDTSEQSKQNISSAIWDFYKKISKDNEAITKEDIFKDSIDSVRSMLDENYKQIFDNLTSEINSRILNSENTEHSVKIISEFSIEEVLKKNSKLQYEIADLSLPEAYNGLGYSNMLYMFIQIVTFNNKVLTQEKLFNILFIEEPESHLHPQMQSTFLSKMSNVLNSKHAIYKIITTHSSYLLQNVNVLSVRYFLERKNNIEVRSLKDYFEKKEYVAFKDFIVKYFKINTCDLFFTDKAILVEGTVERMLMPLMFQMFDDVGEKNNLQNQHVTLLEVGGAYAHIFNDLLNFLEIKTLIVTDIDSIGSSNEKCKCDISTDASKAVLETSNAAIKDWFEKSGEKFLISDIVNLCADEKVLVKMGESEKNSRRIAFQLPLNQSLVWGRTFEEQLLLDNKKIIVGELNNPESSKFATLRSAISKVGIGTVTEEIIVELAFDIVQKLEKTNFAFDLLDYSDWKIPNYIMGGLEWLHK